MNTYCTLPDVEPSRAELVEIDRITGSEDFAYMLKQVPGCLLRIGNGVGDKVPLLHTSRYDFNDDNLTVGAAFWVRLVQRFLAGGVASRSQ